MFDGMRGDEYLNNAEIEEQDATTAGAMPHDDASGVDHYGNPWQWAMSEDEWHAIAP